MRTLRYRRTLAIFTALALASLAVAGVAAAGAGPLHRRHHHPVRHVVVRVAAKKRHPVRKTFAPTTISRAAEVSAVELDPVTQQFMQVTFDRGIETAVSSDSITLEQRQNNAVWRTESFSVPSSAVVTLDRRSATLSQIPSGAAVRIESSGSVGGTQTVVRVNAFTRGRAAMPATQG